MILGKPWSAADTAKLKALAMKNPSPPYRVIAKILGRTRNSVIGRAHRLGIYSTLVNGKRSNLSPKKRTIFKPKADRPVISKIRLLPVPDLQRIANENLAGSAPAPKKDATGANVTVMTVSSNGCRWPYGALETETFHYCGHPSIRSTSWCSFHETMVYAVARTSSARR